MNELNVVNFKWERCESVMLNVLLGMNRDCFFVVVVENVDFREN